MLVLVKPFEETESSISSYTEDVKMSSWQILQILYTTFKNLYLDEQNNQVYIRIQVNLGAPENEAQYVRVTGDTLEQAVSTITASLWQYIPDEIKSLLQQENVY